MTELREVVELHAIRRSIERGDLTWEGAVVAPHHRLANTPMTGPDHPEQLSQDWAPRPPRLPRGDDDRMP